MRSKLTQFLQSHIGPKSSLVKAIADDGYQNWEQHFNHYNSTAKTKADPTQMSGFGMDVYEQNLKEALTNLRITDQKRTKLADIQRFFSLPAEEVEILKRKYGQKAVDMLVKFRLQGKKLEKAVQYEIQLLGKELSLTGNEVDEITIRNATEIYETAVKTCLEDGQLNDTEQRELHALALNIGLHPDTVRLQPQLRERLGYLTMLNELDKGYLPTHAHPSIVLQKAEVAHWQASAYQLVSKTATTGYTTSSSGVSIRVMKGVSYRIGSSRSRPIRQQVTERISGTLVVTSKRVVFNGSGKAFSIPFGQLLSFDPYSNGIGLQKNNGTGYLLEFPNFQVSEVTFKVLQNALNAFFA